MRWHPRRGTIGVSSLVAAGVVATAALVASRAGAPDVAAYVPLPGLLALVAAVLAGVGAGLTLARPRRDDRAALRVLSWWWVLAGVVLIVVSMWSATAVLLFLADTAPDASKRVEMRLDAVKTGLTVGAGAVGLVALLLGVRRQWLGERTQAYQEYDAGERRVTELYTKATDQLGHDKAAVRLAGLHALERVAQDNPEHRQTIVDVICAYLRMPPVPAAPEEGESTGQEKAVDPQELQVRATAQGILRNHLRWSRSEPVRPVTFWPDIDLDLTGAWLVKPAFVDCRMREARFGGVRFEGFARFDRAIFEGVAVFGGTVFTGRAAWGEANYKAGFEGAVFRGDVMFREAVFALRADFREVTFERTVLFSRAVFKDRALFRTTTFAGDVLFGDAVFENEAVFRQAAFEGGTSFAEAVFTTAPAFWEATVREAPGVRRSWPTGWREATRDDSPGTTRLVRDDDSGAASLVRDNGSGAARPVREDSRPGEPAGTRTGDGGPGAGRAQADDQDAGRARGAGS
ncbi:MULTISPECIES: pentapeptide repeat-containing protein [unclassified Streptosporangium]|uniref:pentapeptide repeat-containing protein n=1 Tax=unclassified Streptosporangium TaxID=2632669 RepID=UPI002E2C4DA9|nr:MULTISPECIES: pentapeptide repeat-containing protein [unclassified Streptosporangium]